MNKKRCPHCGHMIRRSHNIKCPHCNSPFVVSIGYPNKKKSGKKRYLCKSCKKSFYNE